MPRFKDYNDDQNKMIPIAFDRQILPSTFEYSLIYLIEHELDFSIFNHRYRNDDEGRPAYDPAILLKIVLLAYSRGMTSSRKIEALCRENVLFMAISADSQPHFMTLAEFVSTCPEEIAELFQQVVLICDEAGLIGREMFAIDGCKLLSNASKEWSGTKADLSKKKEKIDLAVRHILKQHREADNRDNDQDLLAREMKQVEKLQTASRKIKGFLDNNEDRKSRSGKTIQSNITDNESAKMKTSHGVIQGVTGVATVDAKHQVVIQAQAHGQGQEHGLLEPSIDEAHTHLGHTMKQKQAVKITADSGYHNEEALTWLDENKIDGYIADTGFRSRDPQFKDHKAPAHRNKRLPKRRFTQADFRIDVRKQTCVCPAGKAMWLKNPQGRIGHHLFMQFQAYEKDCPVCPLKTKCLRKPAQTTPRQINIKQGITPQRKDGVIEAMKRKIDSDTGRSIYSLRLARSSLCLATSPV